MAQFKLHQLRQVSNYFAHEALNNSLHMVSAAYKTFDYSEAEAILEHMANERKVEAIKLLRSMNSCIIPYEISLGYSVKVISFTKRPGLREAKDLIDALWQVEVTIADDIAQDLGLIQF